MSRSSTIFSFLIVPSCFLHTSKTTKSAYMSVALSFPPKTKHRPRTGMFSVLLAKYVELTGLTSTSLQLYSKTTYCRITVSQYDSLKTFPRKADVALLQNSLILASCANIKNHSHSIIQKKRMRVVDEKMKAQMKHILVSACRDWSERV